MKKKTAVSILALVMALVMILSLFISALPSSAYAVSQGDIDELQKQKDNISSQVQECKERIDQLKEQEANVLEQKSALEVQNQLATEQLDLIAQEIGVYDDMIAEKGEELEQALNREAQQLQRYRSHVRAMEENGGYNILSVIVNSRSFSELLTAIDDIGEIMRGDKLLEEQYIAAREETEEVKAEYEAERAEYEEKQDELRLEQAQIKLEIEEAFTALEELAEAIEQAEIEYAEAQRAEATAAADILAMIRQYNEQKRQKQQGNSGNGSNAPSGGNSSGNNGWSEDWGDDGWNGDGGNDGWGAWDNNDNSSGGNTSSGGSSGGAQSNGSFAWPVPCSTRITGRFAEQRTGHSHAGIDIDGFGNDGNIIVAAASGTVITSGSNASYGNYVIIDHGNEVQTVYAHNSGNAVRVGDYVSQGQTIAYLGATGNATGTHCHFEIIINGGRVDPASYFGGLTYWNC